MNNQYQKLNNEVRGVFRRNKQQKAKKSKPPAKVQKSNSTQQSGRYNTQLQTSNGNQSGKPKLEDGMKYVPNNHSLVYKPTKIKPQTECVNQAAYCEGPAVNCMDINTKIQCQKKCSTCGTGKYNCKK